LKSLNHQHLFYFWHTAHEGSMLAASRVLGVSQPTISVQIGELEKFFGKPLFERLGKTLELTDFGNLVMSYAEDIFLVSDELVEAATGRRGKLPHRVRVGVVDVIPKSVAYAMLKNLALEVSREGGILSVSEGTLEQLLDSINSRSLDVLISDAPLPPTSHARVYSRKLTSLAVNIVGEFEMAKRLRRRFPDSLQEAPFLLPKKNTMLRREVDLWFHENGVHPKVVGEFDDTALMKEFARAGLGVMPMSGEPSKDFGLAFVGELKGLSQGFFLLSPERRNVDAIVEALLRK
jgi:LysR family transcriptional activator of nhaA